MSKLIIVPSTLMDENPDKNENAFARMAKVTRESAGVNNADEITLGDLKKAKAFHVKKAFTRDIIRARELVLNDALSYEDMNRVVFVSSKTFKDLGGVGDLLDFAKVEEVIKKVKVEEITKLLIGTDPELLLVHNGKVVPASSINGFTKQSKFGSDGPMAELRPDPAFGAEGLVENLRKIINDDNVQAKINGLELISACYHEEEQRDYPVGTHVHIDNPEKIAALPTEQRRNLFAVTNKIMDELLTLPLIRLDGPKGHNRRAKCKMSMANGFGGNYGKGYGYFGEWRECHGRLEHRSLSGLVLSNPEIATAVFGTAQAIAEAAYNEALKNDLNREFILPNKYNKNGIYDVQFNNWGDIPLAETLGCVTSSKDVNDMMNSSDRKTVTTNYIKKWLTKIRTLPTYGKFSKHVEALGDILSRSDKSLDGLDKNIKNTWKE